MKEIVTRAFVGGKWKAASVAAHATLFIGRSGMNPRDIRLTAEIETICVGWRCSCRRNAARTSSLVSTRNPVNSAGWLRAAGVTRQTYQVSSNRTKYLTNYDREFPRPVLGTRLSVLQLIALATNQPLSIPSGTEKADTLPMLTSFEENLQIWTWPREW